MSTRKYPLHKSVRESRESSIRWYLRKHYDVNEKNSEGYAPLVYADFTKPRVVKLLVDAGADVNTYGKWGCNPLHFAVMCKSIECVKLLLRAGATVDALSGDGMTALHYAVLMDQYKIVIEHDRDPDQINLFIATRTVTGYEIAYARADDQQSFHDPAVMEQQQQRFITTLPLDYLCHELQQASGIRLDRSLHGDAQGLLEQVLLEASTKITPENTRDGVLRVMAGCDEDVNLEIVRLLLEAGADSNAKDNDGCTPFMIFAWAGTPDAVRLFVDRGADVAARNDFNETALHYAARNVYYPEVVELLIQLGLNVDEQDAKRLTPLHYAAYSGNYEACRILLSHGARVDLTSSRGLDPLCHLLRKRELWLEFVRYSVVAIDCQSVDAKGLFLMPLNDTRKTCNTLLEHIVMLMRVENEAASFEYKNCDFARAEYHLRNHYDACVREVEDLKRAKLVAYGDIALFDVLSATPDRLARYARNRELVNAFRAITHIGRNFPLYSDTLTKRFEREIERQRIVYDAARFLSQVFGFDNPWHVVNRLVMEFLEEKEVYRIGLALQT